MTTEVTVAANSQQENPFQAHGELRQKADYIISHSRISRTEVQIADPDSPPLPAPLDEDDAVFVATSEEQPEGQEDPVVSPAKGTEEKEEGGGGGGGDQSAATSSAATEQRPQPGQTAAAAATVQVDVVKAEQNQNESPQRAEQIKLKSKKRCAIQ